jgi:ATP-dependent DNA helicase RecG
MRPEILFELFKSVTTLQGVGPRNAKTLETATGGDRLVDLLWHLPVNIIDRRYAPKIAEANAGVVATMTVEVLKHKKPHNSRSPYKIECRDETGFLTLVFFHAHEDYLKRALPENETRVVSGTVERFSNTLQMTHPDHIGTEEEIEKLKRIEPVYSLTAGLSLKAVDKAITAALAVTPELPEWLDEAQYKQQGWLPWKEALLQAHAPDSALALEPDFVHRQRLAYDELLANQLALAVVRRTLRRQQGRSIQPTLALQQIVLDALPFELTPSQSGALMEIATDMQSGERMLRLLQGDVGSGKTVVALLSMLGAVEAGHQSAIMAPTEILARQHLATMSPLAEAAGVTVAFLSGREKGKTRQAVLDKLSSGEAQIVIGTHALFQDDVEFKDFAFAVIDEQHRFGVHQRLTLAAKGKAVDMLVMTATPIPRTLMLTAYGDLEVSRLTEKPAGRQPVDTRVMPIERLEGVVAGLKRSISNGARVYWVCPLVEESEKVDAAAAEDRHAYLAKLFDTQRVGLVHGRMKAKDKDAAMEGFKAGELDILVATTVIEVGVDVPEATIMVIEHAERFGLSQLHQLRGRIGRGADKSVCLLLYGQPVGEIAKKRLSIMRETEDGFLIAEEDLKLRGAGELLGTRQSGLPVFHVADLAHHGDLLATARRDAQLILERDPDLNTERGKALRVLLYLFECDAAVKNLRSG